MPIGLQSFNQPEIATNLGEQYGKLGHNLSFSKALNGRAINEYQPFQSAVAGAVGGFVRH